MNIYLPLKLFLILLFFLISLMGYSQNETPKDSISNHLNEVVFGKV